VSIVNAKSAILPFEISAYSNGSHLERDIRTECIIKILIKNK
jgi:hypothetical protein